MNILKHRAHEILLGTAVIIYILVFSYFSLLRLQSFNSHYFDLGIMNQVAYNSAHGRFLEMTNQDLKKNTSRLAIHFDPLLVLFAPLYYIHSGPEVLLIGQAVSFGLGAVAIYLIALIYIKKKTPALLLACSYLIYFPVNRAVLFDFHAVTLAVPLLLFMIYFAFKKQYILSLLCMGLALFAKENVSLVTFMTGAYFFVFHRERKFGIVVMGISVLAFIASVFVIIPYYRQSGHFALRYYGDYGDTPSKIIINIFRHPVITLQKLLSAESLGYLGKIALSNGLFIIASPLEFFLSLPDMLIILLSSNPNMRSVYFHYTALLVPMAYFSAIVGYKRLAAHTSKRTFGVIVVIVIATNLLSFYLYNPVPAHLVKDPIYLDPYDNAKLQEVEKWEDKLGDSVKVATTPKLAPFFTARQYYYNFLFDPAFYDYGIGQDDIIKDIDNYERADYVIVAKSELHEDDKLLKLFYEHLRTNRKFHEIEDMNDIQVYRRY